MERFQGHGVCIQRKGGSPFLFIVGNKGSRGRGQNISSLQEIDDFPRNYYSYCILGTRLTSVS